MGAPSSFSESFPCVPRRCKRQSAHTGSPAPQWTADNVPDQTGRVRMRRAQAKLTTQITIVTGGNSGIGLETVRALLKKHATVYIAARNAETAKAAIDAFQKDPATAAGKVTFLPLDLASFRSIEAFVRAFQERESRLDLLFNSAGVIFTEVCRGCFRFWLTAPVGPCHCGRLRDPLWYQCAWPLLSYETFDPAAACFDKGIAY